MRCDKCISLDYAEMEHMCFGIFLYLFQLTNKATHYENVNLCKSYTSGYLFPICVKKKGFYTNTFIDSNQTLVLG